MLQLLAQRFAASIALLSMTTAMVLPIAAAADDSANAAEYHYSTTITTVYGSPYPIAGHLDLQIFPHGIVRGYYHNAYQKAFIPVTGGRDGNYIWFDIGPPTNDLGFGVGSGRVHIVATMTADGSFKGQLYPQIVTADVTAQTSPNAFSPLGSGQSSADGVLNPRDDQYIFAAKQVDKSSEDHPNAVATP